MKISELAYDWFEQALTLNPEEEILIPCFNKKERTRLANEIMAARDKYKMVDVVKASRIGVVATYRDGNMWVKLFMKTLSPLIGFKTIKGGTTKRINLSDNKARQIKQMLADGEDQDTIIRVLSLSEHDKERFFL